jgi:hypothetical protein
VRLTGLDDGYGSQAAKVDAAAMPSAEPRRGLRTANCSVAAASRLVGDDVDLVVIKQENPDARLAGH